MKGKKKLRDCKIFHHVEKQTLNVVIAYNTGALAKYVTPSYFCPHENSTVWYQQHLLGSVFFLSDTFLQRGCVNFLSSHLQLAQFSRKTVTCHTTWWASTASVDFHVRLNNALKVISVPFNILILIAEFSSLAPKGQKKRHECARSLMSFQCTVA